MMKMMMIMMMIIIIMITITMIMRMMMIIIIIITTITTIIALKDAFRDFCSLLTAPRIVFNTYAHVAGPQLCANNVQHQWRATH